MPRCELSKDEAVPPLSLPARRLIAEGRNLVPRLARAGVFELVFASRPTTAIGAIERKASMPLVDAARKRVPITVSGWQRF